MALNINWTTVVSSAVVAIIIGASQFIANRYLARILDNIERQLKRNNGNGNHKPQ